MGDSDFDFRKQNILIIGMGLIGSSIAMACREAGCNFINGVDVDSSILAKLKEKKVINEGYLVADEALKYSDLTIICLYPSDTAKFLKEHKNLFKKGSVVTDVSGVKADLVKTVRDLGDIDFSFIGGHPMAGKEVGGYTNADVNLFKGANFIITPFACSTRESSIIVESLANIIGCTNVRCLTPEEHDLTIAFTSQLAHVIAVAMCQNSLDYNIDGFTGGSFKDLTRVAEINESLWGEVLNTNSENICKVIDSFKNKLDDIKCMIMKKDNSINDYLRETKNIKRGLK